MGECVSQRQKSLRFFRANNSYLENNRDSINLGAMLQPVLFSGPFGGFCSRL